jgi:hypothetical protein
VSPDAALVIRLWGRDGRTIHPTPGPGEMMHAAMATLPLRALLRGGELARGEERWLPCATVEGFKILNAAGNPLSLAVSANLA